MGSDCEEDGEESHIPSEWSEGDGGSEDDWLVQKSIVEGKKFDDQKEEREKDKEGEHGESPMKEKEKENLDQLKKDSGRGRNFSVTGEEPAEDADEGEERLQGLGDTIMASSSNSQNGDSKELIESETVYKKNIGRDSVFDSRDGVEVGLEDGPGNKLKYGSKKEKENYMEACNKRPNKENKEAHYAVNVKENQRRESAYEHSVIPETGCVRKNNGLRNLTGSKVEIVEKAAKGVVSAWSMLEEVRKIIIETDWG
ncbi:hypothetical protein L6452_43288 [Arctium lappa]|uniref:Uncharacterized protein n=1 Tax=Arctium lappa TaxID=4217 RepID=A0ACB8XLR5_ARCLA|nr:hypothetical protein L6452_43288 [Arctium lappa]